MLILTRSPVAAALDRIDPVAVLEEASHSKQAATPTSPGTAM